MVSINTKEQLEISNMEIKEVVRTADVSNVDDFSIETRERELIGQTINGIANLAESANQVAGLKTRLNARVPINRLPVEIITHIILLTNTWMGESFHPYITYTWVCHHWRSVLIQNAAFWTAIRHWYRHHSRSMEPIYEEVLRRSKSANLDVQLSSSSVRFISTLEKLFAEESDRICGLQVENEEGLIQLVLSGKQFPPLQTLSVAREYNRDQEKPFIRLAPVLVTSDHLETLHYTLWGNTPFDQLAPIFSHLLNLKVYMKSLSIPSRLFPLLHNSAKLQTLLLSDDFTHIEYDFEAGNFHEVVLPELLFLSVCSFAILKLFRAPKLSSLDAAWTSGVPGTFKNINFPPIKYLHIRDCRISRLQSGLCLLGAKEHIRCGSQFSQIDNIFFEDFIAYPRDCFHHEYGHGRAFGTVLPEMSLILPRLTSLVEVHFLITHTRGEFEGLIIHLPSVERLIVKRGAKLLDAIRLLTKSPPLCPRLKHLYFKTFALPRNLKKYVNGIGKSLTNSLQSRQKDSAEKLVYLDLRNCPPLPDTWLKALEDLGTVVVTEKSAENLIIRSREEERLNNKFISDVEIDTV